MKRKIWIFIALVFVNLVFIVSCTNSVSESNDDIIVKALVPEGFVKIKGTTIVGSTKFTVKCSEKAEIIWDEKGVFTEGRTVILSDFYLCDHEVTQKEYEQVVGENPSGFKDNPDEGEKQENRPVESVTWYDTLVYCNLLSMKENLKPCYSFDGETDPEKWGTVPKVFNETWNAVECDFSKNGYRLPTEAEWEYAARGGKKGIELEIQNRWAGTNDESLIEEYAWFTSNSNKKTHEVKKKKPNELGLFDMSGNVYEWTWDTPESSYRTDNYPEENPTGHLNRNLYRVYKGGFWDKIAMPVSFRGFSACKVTHTKNPPNDGKIYGDAVGFRVARNCK